ncbi:pentapeptide repeat-containing protein [Ottowia sp. VDI28]|uniref:pentapeptide repeat-containing protein n=1 Tax=Ottowia sp. VDI28 TaxID=3133968 RepID=UPI003C2FF3A2
MAKRAYGAPAPETHSTRVGESWYGEDLNHQTHTAVLFSELDMTEVTNKGSIFTDCTFRRARFNSSVHVDAAFLNCTFVACKFFDASFTDCKFVGAMFDGCMFEVMRVDGGDWSFAGLPGLICAKPNSMERGCVKST